jgi:hypothetical protein
LIFDFWILNFYCYAQSVSSTELINNAKLYDDKTVVYEGEVIGDVMIRKDAAWVNLNDGNNAIGIWLNASLVKEIGYTGSYKAKGDWLAITGIFHRACLEHGGDLDIHAQAIRKLRSGRMLIEKINFEKRNLIIVLALIMGLVWILRLLPKK